MSEIFYFEKEAESTPIYDSVAGHFCCDNFDLTKIQFETAIAQAKEFAREKGGNQIGVEASKIKCWKTKYQYIFLGAFLDSLNNEDYHNYLDAQHETVFTTRKEK